MFTTREETMDTIHELTTVEERKEFGWPEPGTLEINLHGEERTLSFTWAEQEWSLQFTKTEMVGTLTVISRVWAPSGDPRTPVSQRRIETALVPSFDIRGGDSGAGGWDVNFPPCTDDLANVGDEWVHGRFDLLTPVFEGEPVPQYIRGLFMADLHDKLRTQVKHLLGYPSPKRVTINGFDLNKDVVQ